MEKADVYFILKYIETGEEIQFSILHICEEYSTVSFSPVDEKYNGIGRLPSYVGDDTTKDYEVYVVINGMRHEYTGTLYDKKVHF